MNIKIQEEINKKTIPVFRRYDVVFAGLFGSRTRGDAHPQSDYDFIVRFKNTPSLIKLIKLENELESVLDSEVDVIIEGSEKPFIKQNLEKDLTPIYG